MSRIKNWLEQERIDKLERCFEEGLFDHVSVFTSEEAKPEDVVGHCYFRAYGEVDDAEGEIGIFEVTQTLCRCDTCKGFTDQAEYLSVRGALKWATQKFNSPVICWVSSGQLIADSKNYFDVERTGCEFRNNVLGDLYGFLMEHAVSFEEYGYGNKDVIPVFVEGGKVTRAVRF